MAVVTVIDYYAGIKVMTANLTGIIAVLQRHVAAMSS